MPSARPGEREDGAAPPQRAPAKQGTAARPASIEDRQRGLELVAQPVVARAEARVGAEQRAHAQVGVEARSTE